MKRLFALVLVLLLPISVSAGLLSAIGDVFAKTTDASTTQRKSIQTMNLLASSVAPHMDTIKTEPSVENDALVSVPTPGDGTPGSVNRSASSDHISVYVVRKGDTISQIAEMFGVTTNTIKWSNDLSSNTLSEGQTLVILPISGVKHVVVKGDTVASIAKKYSGDANEILAYNNLEKGDSLEVGSTIIIPDGEMISSPKSSSQSSVAGKVASGLKEVVGFFLRPVTKGVRTQGIHGYNGVDLGAAVGTPVLAAAKGEVIISRSGGWNGGYGTYIVIKHENGTQTLYAHNSSNTVSVGDEVEQGDVIGYVGQTGKATGPHLHFEVRGAKNPF